VEEQGNNEGDSQSPLLYEMRPEIGQSCITSLYGEKSRTREVNKWPRRNITFESDPLRSSYIFIRLVGDPAQCCAMSAQKNPD
jgi:hypothetical protein